MFKLLVDAAVFLDLPAISLPFQEPHRFQVLAKLIDSVYHATWDPVCLAIQPPGLGWRCFCAQYWPQGQGTVPTMFTEQLYDTGIIGARFEPYITMPFVQPLIWTALRYAALAFCSKREVQKKANWQNYTMRYWINMI